MTTKRIATTIRLWTALALAALATGARAEPAAPCPGRADALGTSRVLVVDTTAGLTLGFKTYPTSLDLADHEVVLTFDDGPLFATTTRVLDALKAECVRATFFLIGRNAAASPAVVRREVAEGHTVAHHSLSHPVVTLRGLDEAAARAEIEKGWAADDQAAYGASAGAPRVPFFRFPGFADTRPLLDLLATRHVAVFGADLWASDWLPMSADKERELLLQRLDAAGRGIVLLHDVKAQTAAMLPALLRDLKARGYRVVHVVPGDGAAKTALARAPAGWTSETEATIEKLMPRLLRVARPPARNAPANGLTAPAGTAIASPILSKVAVPQ